MAARFDGTGGTYFTQNALLATKTYPFWYSCWVRMYAPMTANASIGTAYTLLASALPDMSNGTYGQIVWQVAKAFMADGVSASSANTLEAVIPDPYWDHLIFEFRSATDYRIYLNGTLDYGGTQNTNRTIDLSSGSPLTRIGIATDGSLPMKGDIAVVFFGTGNLNDSDRNLLASFTGVGAFPTLTGGTLTNYFKLAANGNDGIGSANFTTVGTAVFTGDGPTKDAIPTLQQAITGFHGTGGLRPELPTKTVVGSLPGISTTGWNLATIEQFDVAWTNSVSQNYTSRGWYLIPPSPNGHSLFLGCGDSDTSNWGTSGSAYNLGVIAQNALANNYSVFAHVNFGSGPGDTGSVPSFSAVTSTYSPMEVELALCEIAMNDIVNRSTKRSFCGLSASAAVGIHLFAIDQRFNHALVTTRGEIADRRNFNTVRNFDEFPKGNRYKAEDFFYLCAANNRRFWSCHQSGDRDGLTCYLNITDPGTTNPILNYITKFFNPVSAAYPFSDVQFILLDATENSVHRFNQATWDNEIGPALSEALMTVYRADSILAGSAYRPLGFLTADNSGFADDLVYSGPVQQTPADSFTVQVGSIQIDGKTVGVYSTMTAVAGSLSLTGEVISYVNGGGLPHGTLTIDGQVLSLALLHPTVVPGVLTLSGYAIGGAATNFSRAVNERGSHLLTVQLRRSTRVN